MTTEISLVRSAPGDLAAHWRSEVQAHLLPHENVLAALEVDLDARLHFVKALVLVTNQRSVAQIFDTMRLVAGLVGAQARAEAWIADCLARDRKYSAGRVRVVEVVP